ALVCSSAYMRAAVDRRYLELQGYTAWDARLSDSQCTPVVTQSEVVFNIPYNGCGTQRQV
ncbi:DMBT1 protein, partial [Rhinopomastus cyanomelas]|nr:DMBT1 protein [Rhinopomastus cyanomelas]